MFRPPFRSCEVCPATRLLAMLVVLIGIDTWMSPAVIAQFDENSAASAEVTDSDVTPMRTRFFDVASAFSFIGCSDRDETFDLLPDTVLNWVNSVRRPEWLD